MGFNFGSYIKILIKGNKVILANTLYGSWIRMSREVYKIIEYGIKNKLDTDYFGEIIENKEDVAYMNELYTKLCDMGMILEDNKKQELKNKIVSFEMTHRCNLNCIHCCIDADGINSNKKDLPTEDVENILNKMIYWKPINIMLSGGEPMLRKDFSYLLKYLRNNYSGKIIIATNGTLINKDNVNILCRCSDQIDISLDGVNEESCALVRGKGVFGKVIHNIHLLQDTGFKKITLSMAVGDKNEYLEEEFKSLNNALGTTPIIRHFSPVGRGKKNQSIFSDFGGDKVYIPADFLCENYNEKFGVSSCAAGKRELFIAYDGTIYPCPSFIKPECIMGNALKIDSLSFVTNNDITTQTCESVDLLNPKNNGKCKDCDLNLFCWTCPGAREDFINKSLDYYCNMIKPVLSKRVWGW